MRSISVSCSLKGFARAVDWLEDYAKSLKDKSKEIISEMLQDGEFYAANFLGHIDTGMTLSTIAGYRQGDSGLLVVSGAAIWLEFGTGVVANRGQAEHPKKAELRLYPWGAYGEGHGSDPNGWYYMGDDGKVHHTFGIPANHFFYNTAQQLRKEYARIAKRAFK